MRVAGWGWLAHWCSPTGLLVIGGHNLLDEKDKLDFVLDGGHYIKARRRTYWLLIMSV